MRGRMKIVTIHMLCTRVVTSEIGKNCVGIENSYVALELCCFDTFLEFNFMF